MEIHIIVLGTAGDDGLRELHRRLTDIEELRGEVRAVPAASRPGALGTLLDALSVNVLSAGAVSAVAGVVVTWIRHRTTDAVIKLRRPDGTEVEVTAERVRRLNSAAVRSIVAELSQAAGPEGNSDDGGTPSGE
ncbi:hypothetical protein AQJ23_26405 [Streptomyces antibioticus]|nr:hypothetical protein [Streptomyces antibioticus]KUN22918.1 hypothetical protein AQJ23_26405 [Streptomyces antibioticus]